MEIIEKSTNGEHEKVLFGRDAASGYRGIIAIHSTVLGLRSCPSSNPSPKGD
jgi:hypothetical protein